MKLFSKKNIDWPFDSIRWYRFPRLQDYLDWSEDLKSGFVSQEYVDNVIDRDSQFRSVYNYFKYRRPQLEKDLDNAYPESKYLFDVVGDNTKTYKELYAEVNRIEREIEENDAWAMKKMIELRQYMWT